MRDFENYVTLSTSRTVLQSQYGTVLLKKQFQKYPNDKSQCLAYIVRNNVRKSFIT